MKILLTGVNGQLGSVLYKHILELKYDIIAPLRCDLDICDVNIFESYIKNNDPDIIINTAAFNDLYKSETNPLETFKHNCVAVDNMAKICNFYNKQFITFSTNYVFNGKKRKQYIETDVTCPIQMYGLSKLSGEYALNKYKNIIIIRTSGLYGISEKGRRNFVSKMIDQSKNNEFIEVSDCQYMNFTYTEDLSKAVLKLIIHPQKNNHRIYHLINEGYVSPYIFVKEIFDYLDINTELVPIKDINNHKINYVIDNGIMRPSYAILKNVRAKKIGIQLPYWKNSIRKFLDVKYRNKQT